MRGQAFFLNHMPAVRKTTFHLIIRFHPELSRHTNPTALSVKTLAAKDSIQLEQKRPASYSLQQQQTVRRRQSVTANSMSQKERFDLSYNN